MKRLLFALLLVPHLVFAQYRSKCFTLEQDVNTRKETVRAMTDKSTVIPLNSKSPIYGLSVSGSVVFDNDQDCYVRIVLKDDYNYEHLVYECYPLLADDLKAEFDNTTIETMLLDGITPQSLSIEVKNAKVSLDSYSYLVNKRSGEKGEISAEELQKEQCQYIAGLMNRNLKERNMTWRARVTSESLKTFEEKKDMYGGEVPMLYGFDYYAGGVFVMPDSENIGSTTTSRTSSTVQYVGEWDWRNRHGKNWMTSVKFQGNCKSCWAFSTIGVLESYVNLYYNRLLNYNLSEQELVSCLNVGCSNQGTIYSAMNYVANTGVVMESCFPYTALDASCNKCQNPSEKIKVAQFSYISASNSDKENYIKERLFNAPLTFCINLWDHAMVLVGYKTISVGDKLYLGDEPPLDSIIIANGNPLIGGTAWLVKNSKGNGWGNNGYGYIVVSPNNIYSPYYVYGNITSLIYDSSDIVCEDADGDGYYFWGASSNKPSYCPSWVPDVKDGNDANYSKGKLLLESPSIIGDLETLNPDGISPLVVSGNTTYTTRQSKYSHIRITSGGKLSVKNILNLFGRVTVTVESGGELVIDGGVVTNASISLASGGKLTLKNGGKLIMRTNTNFTAPVGSIVDASHGEILRSNDF